MQNVLQARCRLLIWGGYFGHSCNCRKFVNFILTIPYFNSSICFFSFWYATSWKKVSSQLSGSSKQIGGSNSHLQFLIETTEAPLVSFAKFSTSANSFSNSANGSTSVLLDSTAFVFPYESKIPALKKHLTTVVSETSFQGIDVHLIAWRRSTDLHTSEAELHWSTLLTTCVNRCL